MKNNFNFLTLSVFHNCEFEEFTSNLLNGFGYKRDFKKGIISVNPDVLNVEQYFDPLPGGHYEKYSWWCSKLYPDTVFLMSNLQDGMSRYCESFAMDLDCPLTLIRTSHQAPFESLYWFEHIDAEGHQRLVYALREDRWVFCDLGEPLPFENLDYYKRRIIKQRINFDIIVEYLSKMGINLWDIDSEVTQCMTFERTAWNQ